MSDSSLFAHHIDQPSEWVLRAPVVSIEGWFFAGPGRECRDVRAVVDGLPHLGIYGFERPDVQAALGNDPGALRVGFRIRTQFWSGARRVSLQWLDASGTWHEFLAQSIDTSALTGVERPRRILPARLVQESLHYLYLNFQRETAAEIRREAERIVSEISTPNTDHEPEAGFMGFVENPGYWINARYEKFRITGWVFAFGRDIAKLGATVGLTNENRLIYGKERPDVAQHHPQHPQALRSNFYGLVDIRADAASPANLKIFALFPDGSKHLAVARRMYLSRREEHSGPVPIYRDLWFWRCVVEFFRPTLLGRVRVDSWRESWQAVRRLQASLRSSLGRGQPVALPAVIKQRRDEDPYTRWCWHNRLTPRLRAALQQDALALPARTSPLISVVVPAYNTPEKYLRELLACLRAQIYPHWELCIADDASPQPHVRRILEEAARTDPRIRPVFRAENGHISRATNSALEIARGDFVALVDHDDLLPDDALLHVAEAIARHPSAAYLYTDEDKFDDTGRRYDHHFKGAWSPEMALTHNYTHHLSVIRRDIIARAGGLRPEFNGAQDIDLFLRCFELLTPDQVVHIPFVCYHWRAHAESTAQRGDQKGYLFDAARRAIAEALQRRGLRAEPFLPAFAQHYSLCLHQLRWDAALLRAQPVTIVIPSKDRVDLLQACLDSLARTVPRESVQVIIVDDASTDPAALAYLAALPARADLRCRVVTAPAQPGGFNYSRLVNLGTAQADTPLVLHLNNDVVATQPGWLEDMVGWMSVPGVGVVGAKLLYPDGTINHAGISISRHDGLAHVLFEREPAEEFGYFFLPHAARNVAAVTGACLLTRTDLYRQLGGFDEPDFAVAYNDVDFCLRAQAAGQRVVITPQAVLTHYGSASRGRTYTEREHVAFVRRHGAYRDPFVSRTLQFPPANLPLDVYHHLYAARPRPFRVLVVTHNLNFEGAPIFIFELARYLVEQPGVEVKVVSPLEGPLRARFEEAGLKPEIWDASAFMSASDPEEFRAALRALAATRRWDDVDLFLCNTLMDFWAVHLAAHLKIPCALYIHESIPVKKFFQMLRLPVPVQPLAEETLQLASRVIYTAKATRDIHEEHNHHDNFRTLASWVDLERIERFAATHSKEELRRKHGLPLDRTLVVNIGSVCERKGQHIYVRAIDQLNKELPALLPGQPPVEFLIIGGRPGLYQESLEQDIDLLGLTNVRIIPETPAIYDFYRLADILVCTSFEESFPRVLLEAMAFRLPIVSTDVNGIPEMLVNNDEAYLIAAGDAAKLAHALKQSLGNLARGDTQMTSLAYAHAARSFRKDKALPHHLLVCREAFLAG
jgi:GT2 family glycosyltransferase/glycosyltransferase involved in cell wall biosynthesis